MITLDLQNCLASQIKNGLSQKKLLSALKKHEKIHDRLKKKSGADFLKLPFQKPQKLTELELEAKRVREHFAHVVFIGIGGSALGAMALFKSLRPYYDEKPELFFIDNPESGMIDAVLKKIDLAKTLLVPISKSGNTIESLAIFSILHEKMEKKLGPKTARHQVISITEDNDGILAQISKRKGFKIYAVPKNIGGRFSVFSSVGLLPAAIAGIDIEKLLDGAKNTVTETAYLLAMLQYLFYQKNKIITVFFPYGRKLEGVSDWYIQLLAESIGKNEKVGPTPLKAIGALDQHAQQQLFMEGPNNKLLIFLEVLNEKKIPIPVLKNHHLHELLLSEKKATAQALATKNRPNFTIVLQKTDEENIGELLFLLQLQVAFLGELFGVNAFDQPGVELGKKLTLSYLQKNG